MFTNPDYELDKDSEEFQRLHPLLSHRDKKQRQRQESSAAAKAKEEVGGRGRRRGGLDNEWGCMWL